MLLFFWSSDLWTLRVIASHRVRQPCHLFITVHFPDAQEMGLTFHAKVKLLSFMAVSTDTQHSLTLQVLDNGRIWVQHPKTKRAWSPLMVFCMRDAVYRTPYIGHKHLSVTRPASEPVGTKIDDYIAFYNPVYLLAFTRRWQLSARSQLILYFKAWKVSTTFQLHNIARISKLRRCRQPPNYTISPNVIVVIL